MYHFFTRWLNDLTDLQFFTSSGKASQGFRHWWIKVLVALPVFLATIWVSREWRVWWLCTRELFVNIVCNGVSKVPVVYEYINMRNWIYYFLYYFVMPSCLTGGVVGVLYPALHIYLIDFYCTISSLCRMYWYAVPQNIVPYVRW